MSRATVPTTPPQVCRALAGSTQLHAVWVVMFNEHVMKNRLPWPSWALPLAHLPSCTLERLCIRAIRLQARCWDQGDSKVITSPLRCLHQAENAVTWIKICCSRWLIVQSNGGCLELWDLENRFDSPRTVFNGVCDAINGSKLLPRSDGTWSLVVSTRSYQAHCLSLHLPGLGVPNEVPHVVLTRTLEGYSELLDASGAIWAFGKERTEQVATVLQTASGRPVRLAGTNSDKLCNLPGAVRILPCTIAVARTNCLDIYDMTTVLSALDVSSICRPKTIHPSQTLAYPDNWTANHLYFSPTMPGWTRAGRSNHEDLYLIFTEPFLAAWVALVARAESNPDEGSSKYRLEEPYYFFIPQDYGTVAVSWGESARRLVYAVNHSRQILLVGACMPSDSSLFKRYDFKANRATTTWSVPGGGTDYPKLLAFDEYTGISAVSMASGRLWVIDPVAKDEEIQTSQEGLMPPHPDPNWPYLPATPWPPETEIFAVPEVVQAGQRFIIVRRDEGTFQHEAKALAGNPSLEDIIIHLREGGTVDGLPGTALAVDECPARQYSAWRARMESTTWGYL
ncbi:hypothetical protein M407DRAFT_8108 [Tulasnella calospora MUT 4182]|uniref:Uncharacterized protein n=1 Tax=Tulasnella calospora MUT 4182 TaxID=1051891 RepID=A0A0C3LX17_9AGAM|nr:hypothetical protein M407DRAFT_8108 [Tulasnella calospora MUT 4182]